MCSRLCLLAALVLLVLPAQRHTSAQAQSTNPFASSSEGPANSTSTNAPASNASTTTGNASGNGATSNASNASPTPAPPASPTSGTVLLKVIMRLTAPGSYPLYIIDPFMNLAKSLADAPWEFRAQQVYAKAHPWPDTAASVSSENCTQFYCPGGGSAPPPSSSSSSSSSSSGGSSSAGRKLLQASATCGTTLADAPTGPSATAAGCRAPTHYLVCGTGTEGANNCVSTCKGKPTADGTEVYASNDPSASCCKCTFTGGTPLAAQSSPAAAKSPSAAGSSPATASPAAKSNSPSGSSPASPSPSSASPAATAASPSPKPASPSPKAAAPSPAFARSPAAGPTQAPASSNTSSNVSSSVPATASSLDNGPWYVEGFYNGSAPTSSAGVFLMMDAQVDASKLSAYNASFVEANSTGKLTDYMHKLGWFNISHLDVIYVGLPTPNFTGWGPPAELSAANSTAYATFVLPSFAPGSTNTSSYAPAPTPYEEASSANVGMIVGIVAGCVGAALIVALAWVVMSSRSKARKEKVTSETLAARWKLDRERAESQRAASRAASGRWATQDSARSASGRPTSSRWAAQDDAQRRAESIAGARSLSSKTLDFSDSRRYTTTSSSKLESQRSWLGLKK